MKNNILSEIYIILAAILWGMIGISVTSLSAMGLSGMDVVLVRSFTAFATLALYLAVTDRSAFSVKCKQENPSSWVLQSYDNTVVLLNNGEVVEVFGNISLDTLPQEDLKHLENGIAFLTKEEALIAVEDYDG